MNSTQVAPAPAWRRYTAWSLDFALLGSIAAGLAWPWLAAAWRGTAAAWGRLSRLVGGALADGLGQAASPVDLAAGLLANPAVQSAAGDVQAGLTQLLLAWLIGYALLAAPYHIAFEHGRWQGSVGKRALRLRVVDARDAPVHAWRLAGRHFAGALSWLTLNLGHALAMLPPARRALHDRLSATRVVCDAAGEPLPAWARAWLALQAGAAVALLAWGAHAYLAALRAALAA